MKPQANARPDPFTTEVIRNALTAIAEEMSLVIMRSARSPLLREAGDLSSALTDADGGLIAQGRDIPAHLGIMGSTVQEFLKRVPKERLQPGDVWFLNLPEVGGNHLPDVKAIRPVLFDGAVQAFAVCLAHWADIGGARRPGHEVDGPRIEPEAAAGPDAQRPGLARVFIVRAGQKDQRAALAGKRGCASRRCASSPVREPTTKSWMSSWPTCAAARNGRATSWPRWPRHGRPTNA